MKIIGTKYEKKGIEFSDCTKRKEIPNETKQLYELK